MNFENLISRDERQVYYHHRDKARRNPERYLSLILDGMDQSKTNIPHFTTETKVRWKQSHHFQYNFKCPLSFLNKHIGIQSNPGIQ